MKILSIGNSFSEDAQRYLHKLAKNEGIDLQTVNLFIGGCSLETHYSNMLNNNVVYELQRNGEKTGLLTSIHQALISDEWDVVTLQQASQFSANFATYTPYIEALASYVKKHCPTAKIYVHQTWAYEDGSERLQAVGNFATAEQMFNAIEQSYEKAFNLIKADGLIPCGKAMITASKINNQKVHRDCFHASFGLGRYMLALTWFKALTGCDICNNSFNEFDEVVSKTEREIAIKAVNLAIENN